MHGLLGLLEQLVLFIDLLGVFVILFGLGLALFKWFVSRVKINKVRGVLGKYILLGLEIMIVSDIIHSFVQTDMDSLYMLGMIVLIRTVISYFLGKELENELA